MPDAIDTQNLYSKTLQVQRMQENQQNQPTNEQQVFADQMRRLAEQRLNQVQATEESRMQKVEDQKPEEKQQREEKRKKREQEEAEAKANAVKSYDQFRGKNIDVEA
jgi:hypothetical protein